MMRELNGYNLSHTCIRRCFRWVPYMRQVMPGSRRESLMGPAYRPRWYQMVCPAGMLMNINYSQLVRTPFF